MKVVAFNGSPRKDGNTFQLVQYVFAALGKEGIETELVQLGGHIIATNLHADAYEQDRAWVHEKREQLSVLC